jgi:RNA polymerase-binding transcription factor DksA
MEGAVMDHTSHGVLEGLGSEVREVQGQIATLRRQRHRSAAEFAPTAEPVTSLIEGAQTAAASQHEEMVWFRLAARKRAVAEAMARVQEGVYGICQACGGRIPRRRLEAVPTATLCVACQERREAARAK